MYIGYIKNSDCFLLYPIWDNCALDDYNEDDGYSYVTESDELSQEIDPDTTISNDFAEFILGKEEFDKCIKDPTYLSNDSKWKNNPFCENEHFVKDLVEHFSKSEKTSSKSKELTVITNFKSIV